MVEDKYSVQYSVVCIVYIQNMYTSNVVIVLPATRTSGGLSVLRRTLSGYVEVEKWRISIVYTWGSIYVNISKYAYKKTTEVYYNK